ncbi:hypothetical protein ILYODFUR_031230, partial [Ilyodon furcidens]
SQVSDDGVEDEDGLYEPAAHQLHSASMSMKRKVASIPRKRSSSSKPTKTRKQLSKQATLRLPLHLVYEDKWHSPDEPDIEELALTCTRSHPPGPRLDTIKSWPIHRPC